MHERRPDRAVAALARGQHGVVARQQLTKLGLSARVIDHRVSCGRLHALHRGVYAVGHRVLSREAVWMAAVLACGREAVLSHRSAAALWEMRPPRGGPVEVTRERMLRSRPAIRVHRRRVFDDEATTVRGIPTTTPSRTLLDLAEVVSARELERALAETKALGLTDGLSLADLLDRHRGRHGAGRLRRALDRERAGSSLTRSKLEERFLAFVEARGLPRPEVNRPVRLADGWVEADFTWRDRGLIVELDGYAFHGSRRAFERDRARDRALQAAGWRVVRVTWRALDEQPDLVGSELRTMLEPGVRAGYRSRR